MGRSLQEPAEPLGAVAVEAPLAERRRREDGIEVGIECIDRRGRQNVRDDAIAAFDQPGGQFFGRSEEHTSELQSLMRISYAVFCLKKKKTHTVTHTRRRTH